MADPRRLIETDAESAPPVPIPAPAAERGALATEPPFGPVPRYAFAASAVLPGSGHLLLGSWGRGMLLLFGWGTFLAVAFLAWDRIAAIPERWAVEDLVAAATLGLGLLLIWGYALRDLRLAERRRDGAPAGGGPRAGRPPAAPRHPRGGGGARGAGRGGGGV
jgi:hypothetical protein